MDRVEEIEAAINELAPEEFERIIQWLRDRDQSKWDAQLDLDNTSGKLDGLFEEAERAPVRNWPE